MKTNGTLKTLLRLVWIILLTLIFSFTHAQPDYDFRNGILISGTDKQIGSVYRFNNVKPGVDAFITITDLSAGISLTDLDAGSGYPEALQPTLLVQPFTSGYLEMKLEFLYAGTNTPYVQAEVPVTCIDVDGIINDGILPVNEFDQINIGGGYVDYQMIGGELLVSQNGNWFTGRNLATIDYPGRDTSAKQAMFTIVNSNISEGIIRVGVDNQSSKEATRLRSVYFKKFSYASSLLPVFGLLSFTGIRQENKSVLNWEMAATSDFSSITIQRSTDGKNFTSIAFLTIQDDSKAISQNYIDYSSSESSQFYRLKITAPGNKISYSNILLLKGKLFTVTGFKIYPNLISSDANINLDVNKKQQAVLLISDYSGRIVKQQSLSLQEGNNTLQVSNLDRLASGNYIAVVRTTDAVYNQRITIR
jgi:hypothetical protein